MKKENLATSIAKLTMAVCLIVGIGALVGMLGYFGLGKNKINQQKVESKTVSMSGELIPGGVECNLFKSNDGNVYSLQAVRSLFKEVSIRDKIKIEGEFIDKNYCMQGQKTIKVLSVNVIEDEIANWETYRNEEYGFEMKFPKKMLIGKELNTSEVSMFQAQNQISGVLLGEFDSGISLQIYQVNDVAFYIDNLSEKYPYNKLIDIEGGTFFIGISVASHTVDVEGFLPIFDKISSTFKKDATADWKIYTNKEYGYEIKYPEDYLFRESSVRSIDIKKRIEPEEDDYFGGWEQISFDIIDTSLLDGKNDKWYEDYINWVLEDLFESDIVYSSYYNKRIEKFNNENFIVFDVASGQDKVSEYYIRKSDDIFRVHTSYAGRKASSRVLREILSTFKFVNEEEKLSWLESDFLQEDQNTEEIFTEALEKKQQALLEEEIYRQYLDIVVLEIDNVVQDIETLKVPWNYAQAEKISIKKESAEYGGVSASLKRQKNKFLMIKKQNYNINPPNNFKTVHKKWREVAELGEERMSLRIEDLEKKEELTIGNYEILKEEFDKSYKSFLDEYGIIKSKNIPNEYFYILDGKNSVRNSYSIELAYNVDLGRDEISEFDFKLYKIEDNKLYYKNINENLLDLNSLKWESDPVDAEVRKIDLDQNGTEEILINQWRGFCSSGIYELNNYGYYNEIWYGGTCYADGDVLLDEIKEENGQRIIMVNVIFSTLKYDLIYKGNGEFIEGQKI